MPKIIDEDGVEYVDGNAVEAYRARFSNTFDMEYDDAVTLSDGDYVTLVVEAEVGSPSFSRTSDQKMRRLNKLKILEVKVKKPELGDEVDNKYEEEINELWELTKDS